MHDVHDFDKNKTLSQAEENTAATDSAALSRSAAGDSVNGGVDLNCNTSGDAAALDGGAGVLDGGAAVNEGAEQPREEAEVPENAQKPAIPSADGADDEGRGDLPKTEDSAVNGAEIPPENEDGDSAEGEESADVEIPIFAPDLKDEIEHKHTNNAKKRKKKTLTFILFIAVNVIVIAITAMFEFNESNEDAVALGKIAANIAQNWYFLLLAFLCFLGIYLFQTLKISLMIKVTTGQTKIRATVNSVILGKYYDNITPLAIGGQPFQAYYLTKSKVPVGTATAAPIVQLFLGTCGFLTIAVLAFIFFRDVAIEPFVKVCAYIGFGINSLTPIAILFFSLLPGITTRIVSAFIRLLAKIHIIKNKEETMQKAISTINDYRASILFMWRSKSTMLAGYLLSVLEKLSEMSITFFVLMACSDKIGSFADYLQITALTIHVYAATSFIPTPGTAGAAEGGFYLVFKSFWPMFIWRLFSYYSYLFFGMVVIISNAVKRSKLAKRAAHEQQ